MTDLKLHQSSFLLYTSSNGEMKIDVFFQDETVWLTQKKMAKLFGVETNTTNYHLKKIFKNPELSEDRTLRKIRIVEKEGNRKVEREKKFYNLDAIISVGYRVNSHQATQFRIWATKSSGNDLFGTYKTTGETKKNYEAFNNMYNQIRCRF